MSKITKELLDEIEERANDAAKIYGGTWDSALVQLSPENNVHAITSETTNDVVVSATDDSRESSWLCDYLEIVSPAAILELVKIARAAEKLVRCKGRYHSEQNYRALAAIFGVTAPDLPPLEGEQEPVADVVAWRKEGEERTCDIRWRRHDVAPGPLYSVPPLVPRIFIDGDIDAETMDKLLDTLKNEIPGQIIAIPSLVMPEEATPDSIEILASIRPPHGVAFQWDEDQRNAAADAWNACRSAMTENKK